MGRNSTTYLLKGKLVDERVSQNCCCGMRLPRTGHCARVSVLNMFDWLIYPCIDVQPSTRYSRPEAILAFQLPRWSFQARQNKVRKATLHPFKLLEARHVSTLWCRNVFKVHFFDLLYCFVDVETLMIRPVLRRLVL
jgi:hypothetical protein